jgi:error-prone DNA polymerase
MVHPYLRRRQGLEKVHLPGPSPEHGLPDELERVLGRTMGVPLFQEQAMRIAIEAARFTPGEANQLRRAMATFRHVGTISTFFTKMVEGMVRRGYDRDFAERCFRQIEGFGTYGFPESHAASFAHLVYVSAWLKCHHPAAFACALLNSQPMGFYAPAQIVRDAREHGAELRAIDVNASDWDCTLQPGAILRLGLRLIGGFRQEWAETLQAARPFADFFRLAAAGLPHPALEALANADAMRSLGLDRRAALWRVRGLDRAPPLPLLAGLPTPDSRAVLPHMALGAHVVADYQATGLSLKAHPLRFLRASLAREGVVSCAEAALARDGARVRVAGVVLVRQRPGTASGVVFATIEDETAIANLVVWPAETLQHRRVVVAATLLLAEGRIQRSPEGVVHLVVDALENRSAALRGLDREQPGELVVERGRGDDAPAGLPRSRDFH